MSAETASIIREPIFDPAQPGASLDGINRLVLPMHRPLDGLVGGDISSPQRGHGYEKDGIREYQPGDNERHVDWYATARSGQSMPLVRERYKDITPNLYVVTDAPQDRNAITQGEHFSEQELALSVGGVMLLAAQKQGMPSKLFAINDTDMYVSRRPATSRSHLMQSSRQLADLALEQDESPDESRKQHLASLLGRVAQTSSKSLVVVVSDFRDAEAGHAENGWLKPLQELRAKNNNIVAIELTNPEDYAMPEEVERYKLDAGKVAWLGGRKAARQTRDLYQELALEQQISIDESLAQVGATHVKLSTTEPRWFTGLQGQLKVAQSRKGKRK